MNLRQLSPIVIAPIVVAFALSASSIAQDATNPGNGPTPPASQNTGVGQRAGRGGMGGGMGAGLAGRAVEGTVTEAAADHFTIKNYAGDTYTIHFSANTRFMKQPPGMGLGGGQGQRMGQGQGGGQGGGQGRGQGNWQGGAGMRAQLQIKASDIKVGDAIAAAGEIDATAKSVGAVMIRQIDPADAKQLQQLEANYGKTWLQGKVTAIDEVKVTIMGAIDNAPHTFMADENTVFRKQRDPVTLADISVGDSIRVEGAINNGTFTATIVNVMGAPGEATTVPRRPRPQ